MSIKVNNFVVAGAQTLTVNKPIKLSTIVVSLNAYNSSRISTFTFTFDNMVIHASYYNNYQSTILHLPDTISDNLQSINCNSSDASNTFFVDMF